MSSTVKDIFQSDNKPEIVPSKPNKKEPDKVLWIAVVLAVVLLVALAVTYKLTRREVGKSQATSSFTACPEANKQHPGHCISSNIRGLSLRPNTTAKYQFAILGKDNKPIKDFDTVHEKKLHLIVVRKDMANFQHVHPVLDQQTGTWTLDNLNLPTSGPYRIFADFTPSDATTDASGGKTPVTVYEDVAVGDMSSYKAQPIGDGKDDKTFGRYQVMLQTRPIVVSAGVEATLSYLFGDAQNGGQNLTGLQPYLGAMGHAVILSENLDFIHAHSMDDATLNSRGVVEFMAKLPKEGKYKIFAQFKHDGKVFTTDFVLPVYKELAPGDVQLNSGNDAHSGHGL